VALQTSLVKNDHRLTSAPCRGVVARRRLLRVPAAAHRTRPTISRQHSCLGHPWTATWIWIVLLSIMIVEMRQALSTEGRRVNPELPAKSPSPNRVCTTNLDPASHAFAVSDKPPRIEARCKHTNAMRAQFARTALCPRSPQLSHQGMTLLQTGPEAIFLGSGADLVTNLSVNGSPSARSSHTSPHHSHPPCRNLASFMNSNGRGCPRLSLRRKQIVLTCNGEKTFPTKMKRRADCHVETQAVVASRR
jgi:hypothetical protein